MVMGSFGVKVKLIEPGVTKTDFGGRSMDVLDSSSQSAYIDLMEKVNAFLAKMIKAPGSAELVAATIFGAANDPSDRLRYLSGSDAKRLWLLRRWLAAAYGITVAAAFEKLAARFGGVPMGRMAEPAEVASLISFLVSPAAACLTGANYFIDGGALPVI
jgi:NAD(P)-dependent dehydrogenase (short-subunit alcohol dehydrogenase family)